MMKVTKILPNGEVVMDISDNPNKDGNVMTIGLCHDYLLISGTRHIQAEGCRFTFGDNGSTTNTKEVDTSIQVPIHVVASILLPYLQENKYTQMEHAARYAYKKGRIIRTWEDEGVVLHIPNEEGGYDKISEKLYNKLTNKPPTEAELLLKELEEGNKED